MTQRLPLHLFTIVLNGNPFIRYHIEVLRSLGIEWHWHIVEGVAELKHDTAWGAENGGAIPPSLHSEGRSVDGTSEYLDQLKREYPENVSIYRKPPGVFWDGKREMVNAPLSSIHEDVLLLQVDSDELWSKEQLENLQKLFVQYPEKTSAWFWCWFFVGPDLVLSSRNCYGANPSFEWNRAWRFSPGSRWIAHEPPQLVNALGEDLGRKNPFPHGEMEKEGLIFQHMGYVTEEQLRFKESYYGYQNAYSSWMELQKVSHFPVLLRDHFGWVKDSAVAEPASRFSIDRLAELENGEWRFHTPTENRTNPTVSLASSMASSGSQTQVVSISSDEKPYPTIVIDGVFFAEHHRGIARVWKSFLERWGQRSFGSRVVLLDRGGTAPHIEGIRNRLMAPYEPQNFERDRMLLGDLCREESASLFMSTYYTTAANTPSVLLVHDMIPEVLGWDMNSHSDWRDKQRALQEASGYVCGSENTRKDLHRFCESARQKPSTVVHNAHEREVFAPASAEEILAFHEKFGVTKPYYLLVGARLDYKNAQMFFDALSLLPLQHGVGVFCTGNNEGVLQYGRERTGAEIYNGQLSDKELAVAYTGAVALVFPSVIEGFGLPLLEAMGCHCPVIGYPNGATQEVMQNAGLYASTAEELTEQLCEVQKPSVRKNASSERTRENRRLLLG
jgi:glycosyltransferase involved in cell wall biosynthesis